jgi:hypothetical protein
MKIESFLIALFSGPIFNAGAPVLLILRDTAGRLWVGIDSGLNLFPVRFSPGR